MKSQIIIEDPGGLHNSKFEQSRDRLLHGNTYKDVSTVCIIPTRGMIHAKVVQSWWSLMTPMNQKFIRIFMIGMEVGEAYSAAIDQILANPELSKWKYILTLEEDNLPPVDGLLKLYENTDNYDIVGGLYWTKGEGGQPMIYGDPKSDQLNFIPQVPRQETMQETNGLGMGFTLFKLDIFKNPGLEKPFFETQQQVVPGQGIRAYTQDLNFFEKIYKLGYKVACDTRVKVGHYDPQTDIVW